MTEDRLAEIDWKDLGASRQELQVENEQLRAALQGITSEAEDNRRLRISLADAHSKLRQCIQTQTLADVKLEVVYHERDKLRAKYDNLWEYAHKIEEEARQSAAEVERLRARLRNVYVDLGHVDEALNQP
jgi:uncharacterized coiled-coil DUF342 family protein